MKSRDCRGYVVIYCILVLFASLLLSGCIQTQGDIPGIHNTSGQPSNITGATISSGNSSVFINGSGEGNADSFKDAIAVRSRLDTDWKTLRVINTDLTDHYLTLDLSKAEDINDLRYTLIPETTSKIANIRSDLETLQPVTPDQVTETETLIAVTNYTLLKYEGLSQMLHATQYANMHDPVSLKSEIRNAKFTVMDALDIINAKDNADYPSRYRDQIAADKSELQDMAAQIDTYTRSVYLAPTD